MQRIAKTAGLLIRAKLKQRGLAIVELTSPSVAMLLTFVLGWAISTDERAQAYIHADATHKLFHNQANIFRTSSHVVGIPDCLSTLSRALDNELAQREQDLAAAQRLERWRLEMQSKAQLLRQRQHEKSPPQQQVAKTKPQRRATLSISQSESGHDGGERASGTDSSQGGSYAKRATWQRAWGTWRQRGNLNTSISPGETAGRQLVMSLLTALRRPAVAQALEQCRWTNIVQKAAMDTVENVMDNVLGPTMLPTFDEWVLLSAAINTTLEGIGGRQHVEALLSVLLPVMPLDGMQPGWLALVPNTPQVRAFAAHMSSAHALFDDVFLGIYDTAADAISAAAVAKGPAPKASGGDGHGGSGGQETETGRVKPRRPIVRPSRLWAVLEFASGPEVGGGVDYAVRMNTMHVPSTFAKLTQADCKTCASDFLPYVASGFLSLQGAVSGYVMGRAGVAGHNDSLGAADATAWLHPDHTGRLRNVKPRDNSERGPYGIWLTPFPNLAKELNSFYEYSAPAIGMLTVCSFALPLAMMVRLMVSQRLSGVQHLLQVMGLSPSSWQMAWFLAVVPFLACAFALEGGLASWTYLRLADPWLLLAVMGAAAVGCAAWAVLLGSVFTDPKVAANGSFIVTLLSSLPFLAVYGTGPTQLLAAKRALCMLWPVALSLLLHRMATGHQVKVFRGSAPGSLIPGLQWSTAGQSPLSTLEVGSYLVLDAVLYLIMAAVLEYWRARPRPARGGRSGDAGADACDSQLRQGEAAVALELRGLSHQYPSATRPTLKDVSLSVHAGEAVALLGRNAAGKSTLVAITCGRLIPSLGGVVCVGRNRAASGGLLHEPRGGGTMTSRAYRNLGYCPQRNILLPDLTVREHLELALVLRGAAGPWNRDQLRHACEQLVELVSLPRDMMQVLSNELSGGSKRKLQLAMAMAGQPPVLLLDEVTAGVDAESRQAIWRALLRAKEGPWGLGHGYGKTEEKAGVQAPPERQSDATQQSSACRRGGAALLFTSHHIGEVTALADQIAVLDAGCILSQTPAAVLGSSLRGAHRVIRITTRPAATTAQPSVPQISPAPLPATPSSTHIPLPLTRTRLMVMLRNSLGANLVYVLYSNLTTTAVCVAMSPPGHPVSTTSSDTSVVRDSAAVAAVDALVRKLHNMAAGGMRSCAAAECGLQPPEGSLETQDGRWSLNGQEERTSESMCLASDPSRVPVTTDSDWEERELVVVRCTVGPPTLEDILALDALELGSGGGSSSYPSDNAATDETPISRGHDRGPSAARKRHLGHGNPQLEMSADHTAEVLADACRSRQSAVSVPVQAIVEAHADRGPATAGVLADRCCHEPLPDTRPLGLTADNVEYTSGLFADTLATVPTLLVKQWLQWRRDMPSMLRLLLLPVLAVAVASVALRIKPSSTGPAAPLHLGWLGQRQPVPVDGLPNSWSAAAAQSAEGIALNGSSDLNATRNGPHLAALHGLGLVPLRREWLQAFGAAAPSSLHMSHWLARGTAPPAAAAAAASKGRTATRHGGLPLSPGASPQVYGEEPMPPLQAAIVFNDTMPGKQLWQVWWSEVGRLMEALLAPSDPAAPGLHNVPKLRATLQAIFQEEDAAVKTADFLYDRMLLHEFFSAINYVARVIKPVSSPPPLPNDLSKPPGRRRLSQSFSMSFFRLGQVMALCNLTAPTTKQQQQQPPAVAGVQDSYQGGGGSSTGRKLQISYRPPLNLSIYLMAGLLPTKPCFCPLARLLVDHSQAITKVARGYMGRWDLPPLTLMWNITSPHGLPATLNHLHSTMLRMHTNTAGSASTSDRRHDAAASTGIASASGALSYEESVYGSGAPIRVRSHPLPLRGSSPNFMGLIDHLLLAVMVAMPLCYTTGSFVARVAQEAASGAKQQQLNVGRCSPLSYWLSAWLSDLALHGVLTTAVLLLLWVGGAEAFTGSLERCLGLAVLLLAFAAASLPWGYCISLRCNTPAEAQGLVSNAGLVTGVGLALARQMLAHVRKWSWVATALLPVLRLSPAFCMVDALLQLSLLDVVSAFARMFPKQAYKRGFVRTLMEAHLVGIDPDNPSPFQTHVLGDNLVHLACNILLYGALLMLMETRATRAMSLRSLSWGACMEGLRKACRMVVGGMVVTCKSMFGVKAGEASVQDQQCAHIFGFDAASISSAHRTAQSCRKRAAPGRPMNRFRSVPPMPDDDSGGSGVQGGGVEAPGDEEGCLVRPPAPSSSCLVRVCDVHKVYSNGKVALHGLTFGLKRGECLALIGRNGAGKSTAMAILSGQLRPSAGSVVVGGVEVAGQPSAARNRVAVCPQTNPLLPLLTPSEHLALYSALRGDTSSWLTAAVLRGTGVGAPVFTSSSAQKPIYRASNALSPTVSQACDLARRCGLGWELMDRPAGQLSGGSQRKLSLAIALLGQPQLLLLDEPSAGMDTAARRAFCDAINMAVRGGSRALTATPAMVLATHYSDEVLALCDVVGVMESGRLLAYGVPELALRSLPRWHYLADPEEWEGVLPAFCK